MKLPLKNLLEFPGRYGIKLTLPQIADRSGIRLSFCKNCEPEDYDEQFYLMHEGI